MNKNMKTNLHIGGSLEKAEKGDVELPVIPMLKEAANLTIKNYVTFFPALLGLFLAQLAILLFALKVQLGDPMVFFNAVITGTDLTDGILKAGYLANYASDILSAPLYVSVCWMALNHAVGLPSKPSQLVKGFSFAAAAIITALLTSAIQGLGNALFPIIGMLLSMCFGFAIILIFEKRLSPIVAIKTSTIATLRKLMPITAVYLVVVFFFVISFATAGLGLFWALPFFFNVKAVMYRNMFGITLNVVKLPDDSTEQDNNQQAL